MVCMTTIDFPDSPTAADHGVHGRRDVAGRGDVGAPWRRRLSAGLPASPTTAEIPETSHRLHGHASCISGHAIVHRLDTLSRRMTNGWRIPISPESAKDKAA